MTMPFTAFLYHWYFLLTAVHMYEFSLHSAITGFTLSFDTNLPCSTCTRPRWSRSRLQQDFSYSVFSHRSWKQTVIPHFNIIFKCWQTLITISFLLVSFQREWGWYLTCQKASARAAETEQYLHHQNSIKDNFKDLYTLWPIFPVFKLTIFDLQNVSRPSSNLNGLLVPGHRLPGPLDLTGTSPRPRPCSERRQEPWRRLAANCYREGPPRLTQPSPLTSVRPQPTSNEPAPPDCMKNGKNQQMEASADNRWQM